MEIRNAGNLNASNVSSLAVSIGSGDLTTRDWQYDDGKDRLSRLGAAPAKNGKAPRVAHLVCTKNECYVIRGDGRREMASGLANAGFKKFTLDPSTTPKSIDLQGFAGKSNEKTKTYAGIYRITKGELTICYCEQGSKRPVEFLSDGANNLFQAERVSAEPLPKPNLPK